MARSIRRYDFLPITGLALFSMIIMLSYLSIAPNHFDMYQQLSALSFSIGIPSCGFFLFERMLEIRGEFKDIYFTNNRIHDIYKNVKDVYTIIILVGVLIDLLGIGFYFFHFSIIDGILFIIISFTCELLLTLRSRLPAIDAKINQQKMRSINNN